MAAAAGVVTARRDDNGGIDQQWWLVCVCVCVYIQTAADGIESDAKVPKKKKKKKYATKEDVWLTGVYCALHCNPTHARTTCFYCYYYYYYYYYEKGVDSFIVTVIGYIYTWRDGTGRVCIIIIILYKYTNNSSNSSSSSRCFQRFKCFCRIMIIASIIRTSSSDERMARTRTCLFGLMIL